MKGHIFLCWLALPFDMVHLVTLRVYIYMKYAWYKTNMR